MKRLLTVSLAVLLGLGVLGWGIVQYRGRMAAEYQLNARYQQAFFSLTEHVEQAQVLLAKAILSNAPEHRVQLLSDVWYETNAAQSSLNQLPVSQPILGQTSKFLTQAGDYCYSLVRRTALGQPLTSSQLDQVTTLHNSLAQVGRSLQDIQAKVTDGSISWREVKDDVQGNLPEGKIPPGANSFRSISMEIENQQPVLIYDGPFSDHLRMQQPKGLSGENISLQQAKEKLKHFANVQSPDQWEINTAPHGRPAGKIPAYALVMTNGSTSIYADVSKKGGDVVWMTVRRSIAAPALSREELTKKALTFIKRQGQSQWVPSFINIGQKTATVVLVPLQDEVLLYPDQIKVEVALDNGQVTAYDGLGFLMAHHRRQLPAVEVPLETARQKLNNRFKVNSSRLALIPLDSGKEALAWEFRGTLNQEQYYIYINALNGREENIFRIISNSSGQLAL